MNTTIRVFSVSAFVLTLLGCKVPGGPTATSDVLGDRITPPKGFEETILVGQNSPKSQLALLQIAVPDHLATGAAASVRVVSKKPVIIKRGGSVAAVRARDGRFYVALEAGRVVVVDGKSASILYDQTVGKNQIFDLEIDQNDTAYVSFSDLPVVKKIDLRTGRVMTTFDLGVGELAGMSGLGARRMKLWNEKLFVVVEKTTDPSPDAFLVEVGKSSPTPTTVFRLSSNDLRAQNLNLPLVIDPFHQQLVIGAKGNRPYSVGLTILFDLPGNKIAERRVPPTFNGLWVFSEPLRKRYILDHTSTPVPSTHIMPHTVTADGSETSTNQAVLDVFQEIDDLTLNSKQTLAMLPCQCPSGGICETTKGVNFFDVAGDVVLPSLTSRQMGFAPNFAIFR